MSNSPSVGRKLELNSTLRGLIAEQNMYANGTSVISAKIVSGI